MKTSNKLLIALVVMIMAYSIAEALALKAEYLKGNYKNRFYGKTEIKLADFDAIEDYVANSANVTIEYGKDYAIWVDKDAANDITITKNKRTLLLDYKAEKQDPRFYNITIICPKLTSIKTGYRSLQAQPGSATTAIEGFTQDSLTLWVNNNSNIKLQGNVIKGLGAVVNFGELVITNANQIDNAAFDIQNESSLIIEDADIQAATYKYSGKAKVSLKGKALNSLPKS